MNLEACRGELQSIIRELRDIETGIRNDFSGIGQEMCANCVNQLIGHYGRQLTTLNNVNQNRLADWILGT